MTTPCRREACRSDANTWLVRRIAGGQRAAASRWRPRRRAPRSHARSHARERHGRRRDRTSQRRPGPHGPGRGRVTGDRLAPPASRRRLRVDAHRVLPVRPVAVLDELAAHDERRSAPRTEWGRRAANAVTRPRPGHADLAGVAKYDHTDVRDGLERASARETRRALPRAPSRSVARQNGSKSQAMSSRSVRRESTPSVARWNTSCALPADAPFRCVDSAVKRG